MSNPTPACDRARQWKSHHVKEPLTCKQVLHLASRKNILGFDLIHLSSLAQPCTVAKYHLCMHPTPGIIKPRPSKTFPELSKIFHLAPMPYASCPHSYCPGKLRKQSNRTSEDTWGDCPCLVPEAMTLESCTETASSAQTHPMKVHLGPPHHETEASRHPLHRYIHNSAEIHKEIHRNSSGTVLCMDQYLHQHRHLGTLLLRRCILHYIRAVGVTCYYLCRRQSSLF